jgi:TolB-like protein/class 3 adenylate cyclase
MADDTHARRLATIVALDVAGYSARTEADEDKTATEVIALRSTIEGIAKAHAGRIFNTAGDGFMLEFGSSVAAVEAALALAEQCEPKVRVGVHLGDVVVQANGDLLGHGVNVAARLMAQSSPGSALISSAVRQTIRGPLGERLVSHGLLQLDKMSGSIEAFALTARTSGPPGIEETLKPGQRGDVPSLAVLPFANRSGLPEDDVFAEGMVEDLIMALSEGVNIRVLGSTSTAHLHKGATINFADVGRQLGVRYLLEGNVRRTGADLRVATQLLEAATGAVLSTGKFVRPLSELAQLQEQLVLDVAGNLDAQVFNEEMKRALKKPRDITAWEAVMRSSAARRRFDEPSIITVIAEAERAIRIAPDYGLAYAFLGDARAVRLYLPSGTEDAEEIARIRALIEHALALEPDHPFVLSSAGNALNFIGFPEEALPYTERAMRKAPASAMVHYCHGIVCLRLGRQEAAFAHINAAVRLLRGDNALLWTAKLALGSALIQAGRPDEAETVFDELIGLAPGQVGQHAWKAVCCRRLGREDEARRHMQISQRQGETLAWLERFTRPSMPEGPTRDGIIGDLRDLWAKAASGA